MLESIEKGEDDSASESDDDLELRYETDDEEAKDVENDDDSDFTEPLTITDPKTTSFRNLSRSITIDMLDEAIQHPFREIPGLLIIISKIFFFN
jgi:hypothetical protein